MPIFGSPYPVYLVDINCFKPAEDLRVDRRQADKIWRDNDMWVEDADFIERVFKKSGIGYNNTFLPPAIHPKFCGGNAKTDLKSAQEECELVVFGKFGDGE
jgi:hypothetical protein